MIGITVLANKKDGDSPVQRVIDAIVATKEGLEGRNCILDWDLEGIQNSPEKIQGHLNNGGKKILFIRTPFGPKDGEHELWYDLLACALHRTRSGVMVEIDEVIPHILESAPSSSSTVALSDDAHIKELEKKLEGWKEKDFLGQQPTNPDEILETRRKWQAWEALSYFAGMKAIPHYAQLVGGMRPLLFVFDDYSNFIRTEDGAFQLVHGIDFTSEANRFGCKEKDLKEALGGFCGMLNNLASSFEVKAPALWIEETKDAGYGQVVKALPFVELEALRPHITAFVVDLEWRPLAGIKGSGDSNKWGRMGHKALHILARRFPEIPSFIYTGEWELQNLQDGLAYGAEWSFRKWKTHHPPSESEEGEPLTAFGLQQHLAVAAKARYEAFSEAPYPEQLRLDPADGASTCLLQKMHLRLPLEREARGKDLQQIVATLFSDGSVIRPVKVFDSGKSKAQAAFIVSSSRNGVPFATRFMKVAPWLEIQREYLAYQRVIRPRLNTYVANIVEKPVLACGIQGEMPLGAVVYSMAGLPEGYADLEPLHDLLKRRCIEDGGGERMTKRMRDTLEQVLLHLYGVGGDQDGGQTKEVQRPLWDWLGEVLPPVFTGVLVPMEQLGGGQDDPLMVCSWRQQGYKDNTAWLMAARDTMDILDKATKDKQLSPWHLVADRVVLSGFLLREAEWGNDADTGEITLAHPDLGLRIRLRGRADDIQRRFGAIWTRSGLPVEVEVCIEKENREFEKIKRKLHIAFSKIDINTELDVKKADTQKWLNTLAKIGGTDPLLDPFELFGSTKQISLSFTITAHQSPVHGDLNLHNILFSGEAGPGWLIDFDRSDLCGMPAFDLAKLEAEIWHHHLFPLFEKLAAGPDGKAERCIGLLNAAQTAADIDCNSGEMFISLVRTGKVIKEATDGLLLPVCNLLSVIATIREFGRERLKLDDTELHWALASYFFIATKFASGEQPWRAIFSFFASARYLTTVAPLQKTEGGEELWKETFEALVEGGQDAVDKQDVDGLLLKMTESSGDLDGFTKAMAETRDENQFEWSVGTECWDLASTGSVTNITPIFGYLWLMVKAQQEKENDTYKVVVPKISSPGASCGTVDILESGGLSFPSEPDAIKEACLRDGGVLCRQHESLTPIDKVLMNRRKKTNTMKNVALVYASILAKKIAMGCTHAIVDVKVGRDTKILAPWMDDDKNKVDKNKVWLGIKNKGSKQIRQTEQGGAKQEEIHLICPDMGGSFEKLLKSNKMLGSKAEVQWKKGQQWVEQTCVKALFPLQKVLWFFTDADMPQCRAIGRQLILLHLDDLILGTYGDELLDKNEAYKELYKVFLPKICDLKDKGQDDLWGELKDQWSVLKLQLSEWNNFSVMRLFDDLLLWRKENDSERQANIGVLAQNTFEKGRELVENMDLRIITLALGPYQPSVRKGEMVQRIDAWKLDSFFDWLCGEESLDPEVCIYLHCLPGENVSSPHKNPFISVCYRPSRTPEREVLERIRCFLSEHVAIKPVVEPEVVA